MFFFYKYEEDKPEAAISGNLEAPSISSKLDLNNNDHLEKSYHHHQHHHQQSMESVMTYSSEQKIISESKTTLEEKKVPWRKTKLILCGICLAAYFSAENGYFYYCKLLKMF